MHRSTRFKIFNAKTQRPLELDNPKSDDQNDANTLDNVASTDDPAGGYGDSSGFADKPTGVEL